MARTTAIALEVREDELARRLLWRQPHSEIMAEMGLTYNQFRNTIDSESFKAKLENLQRKTFQELDERFRGEMDTVQSRARSKSLVAVDTLIQMMEHSPSESLKRDCAKDIIDLAGESDASKRPVIQIGQATFQLIQKAREEDETRGRTIDIPA